MDSVVEFSIIIPIYDVEAYLCKCLDSVIFQSFNNWEAILIDDGSLDNCPNICDEYAKKDIRIKVFHIENGGVSLARNVGLNNARGKYIVFLDADDYLSQNYLSILYKSLSGEIDMLYYGSVHVSAKEEVSYKAVSRKIELLSLKEVCRRKLYSGYVWTYVYKRSIIEEHKLRFSIALKYAEDWEFILKYYCHIRQMVVIPDCLYYQLQREGSATQRKLGEVYLEHNFEMFDNVLSYTSVMPFFYKKFAFIQFYKIIVWFVNNVISTDILLLKKYRLLAVTLKKKHTLFCAFPIVWLPYVNRRLFVIATKTLKKTF